MWGKPSLVHWELPVYSGGVCAHMLGQEGKGGMGHREERRTVTPACLWGCATFKHFYIVSPGSSPPGRCSQDRLLTDEHPGHREVA